MKKSFLLVLFICIPLQAQPDPVSLPQNFLNFIPEQTIKSRLIDSVFSIGTLVTSTIITQYILKKFINLETENEGLIPQEELVPTNVNETFNSVAGVQAAKEELFEVVDFLKNPNFYTALGAKIPRGILLTGEPGNGKTLLARAVAGESECPFIYASGSEFIEVYTGLGAARVRKLFEKARQIAPCIIFIDEIDAIGSKRTHGPSGGTTEHTQTLNQLLNEMDGFVQTDAPIIIIGATNREDILDNALLRPGRFDRKVHVPYPNLKGRNEILELHAKKIKLDASVDIYKLACGTPGFSGAELANLINEATLLATKKRIFSVTFDEFEEARDKILLGKVDKTITLTDREKLVTAFHESGHALIRLLLPTVTDPLYKVTIVPRGNALGVTHSLPEGEKHSTTKEEMLASIQAALGGRIAEEIMFNEIATGAYSDFKQASAIARNMVSLYGMSDLGTISYENGTLSPETANKIEQEIRTIVDQCYKDAKALLENNKPQLTRLAYALLEAETLYADEIYELLNIKKRTNYRFN